MSKISKFFKHPVLFFKDRKKKILMGENRLSTTVNHILSTIINKIPVANVSLLQYEVALYYSGSMDNIYQIEQWINTFNVLDEKKKIVVIVRGKAVYDWLQTNTNFVVVYAQTIEGLTKVYEENNFKCILYVNHAFKNFQSLMTKNAIHVHINHGESEKTSTFTNQSKAYDYVFIVGEAAYDKYNLNLIKKNMVNFIRVGRPQLDHIEEIAPFNTIKLKSLHSEEESVTTHEKKVILYAPTWEGTHDSMNFTSINDYGMPLVQQLVNHPNYYLVYKPHPNTGSRDAITNDINNAILKLLTGHDGGEAITSGDINSLYKHVDLAIFDNSTVAIDYLQVDKPMIMTDMFNKSKESRQSKPTIVKAARMLSVTDTYSITMIISEEIEKDTYKKARDKIRHYFLGDYDYTKKESTDKFVTTVLKIIEERDQLVEGLNKLNEEKDEIC